MEQEIAGREEIHTEKHGRIARITHALLKFFSSFLSAEANGEFRPNEVTVKVPER